ASRFKLSFRGEMLGQESQRSGPRRLVGMAAIAVLSTVHKSMARAGIREKLMRFLKLRELRVEFRHVFGRRVLIVCAKMTLERTEDFSAALERRRKVASHGAKGVARIIGHRRVKGRVARRHEVDHPSAHAETDDADAFTIDGLMA